MLSQVLKSKRNLSEKLAQRVSRSLDFKLPLGAAESLQFNRLLGDHFRVITDWYNFAILELLSIKGTDADPKAIAKTLHISPAEAQTAIACLARLGLIEQTKEGSWHNVSGHNTVLDDESVADARRLQQIQILKKALEALENVPIAHRDQSSMILAVDRKLLPEARRRLTKMRRELTQFLQSQGETNDVYCLSFSYFPLTTLFEAEEPNARKHH
ncbi:MAG: DUF4423 domain-containing protein [Deltaproteobacteria bacterium]|nr:DUF4423 domain-containing protein [Deltaproteobacteria bacterium]